MQLFVNTAIIKKIKTVITQTTSFKINPKQIIARSHLVFRDASSYTRSQLPPANRETKPRRDTK